MTTKIYDLLNEGKPIEAIQYFKAAKQAWPESCSSQKTTNSEEDKSSQSSDTGMEIDNNGYLTWFIDHTLMCGFNLKKPTWWFN